MAASAGGRLWRSPTRGTRSGRFVEQCRRFCRECDLPCHAGREHRSMSNKALRLDEIGYWSEVKLEIVRKYATAYSVIMAKQPLIRRHIYVDAFAGAGQHISKSTGDFVPGSPLNAVRITPPF